MLRGRELKKPTQDFFVTGKICSQFEHCAGLSLNKLVLLHWITLPQGAKLVDFINLDSALANRQLKETASSQLP